MDESVESYYGINDFIEATKRQTSEGLHPGTYSTDQDFEDMTVEKGPLAKFFKDHLEMSRFNVHVRKLTIYSSLLMQYIGGMLRNGFIFILFLSILFSFSFLYILLLGDE